MLSIPGALAVVAVVAALPAHAVNKCTQPDGRIVYSDAPCPASTSQAQILKTAPVMAPMSPRPTRPVGQQGANAAAEPPALQIPPPQSVTFSGMPESDLSWAASTMDKIRVLGRDCDWALRVDRNKVQGACVAFLAKMQPRGEFEQINARVVQVLRQEPSLMRRSRVDFGKYEIFRDEALSHREMAMARLGVAR